jgi:hypothetical protein
MQEKRGRLDIASKYVVASMRVHYTGRGELCIFPLETTQKCRQYAQEMQATWRTNRLIIDRDAACIEVIQPLE